MKKNILVFPCGSEIALEVYRSVKDSTHFHLIGASSVDDHGKFVYEDYIGGLPFVSSADFLPIIKKIVKERNIDAIYPAMDAVIEILKTNESAIGCKVVSSPAETTQICLSKKKTYQALSTAIRTPAIYTKEFLLDDSSTNSFPVFAKPDIGYGSRGAKKIKTRSELKTHLADYPSCILTEYLPGKEYTVDCFTNSNGELLFAKARERSRIMNGISVNTKPVTEKRELFHNFAEKINSVLTFEGAWFFQVKQDSESKLTLMEVASRFGGSSSLFRAEGVNFALMSLFQAFNIPVSVIENNYPIEMDRALDNRYRISLKYDEIFVDFDDCIYLDKKNVNTELVAFLYESLNKGTRISLLTKHDDEKLGKLDDLLDKLRIRQIFDRILHIHPSERKIDHIDNTNAIFIDDSFAERKAVSEKWKMPVFSLDMIEVLR